MRRRSFLGASGAAALVSLFPGCAAQMSAPPKPIGRVVVVGAGYGGATAAKYLRMWSRGTIEVLLIERNTQFVSCPTSNLVLGGSRTLTDITRGYANLHDYGVQMIHDEAVIVQIRIPPRDIGQRPARLRRPDDPR